MADDQSSQFALMRAIKNAQDGPPIDWSKLNQPMGQLKPATYTPTQQIGNAVSSGLILAGMQPYTANDLTSRVGNVLGASPLGLAGSAIDTIGAKAQGDNAGIIQGMAGMIPGAGPEAKAAWSALRAQQMEGRDAFRKIENAMAGPAPEHVDPFAGMNDQETADAFEKILRMGDPPQNLQSRILDTVKSNGGVGVHISDVAAKLPDVPLKDIHDEMLNLQKNDQAVLSNWDDPRSTTPAMKAAAINIGGDPRHVISLTEPSPDRAALVNAIRGQ
jgi:hypothetical protein